MPDSILTLFQNNKILVWILFIMLIIFISLVAKSAIMNNLIDEIHEIKTYMNKRKNK